MDLQTRKIEFVQKILKIQNEELLSQLEDFLINHPFNESLGLTPMSIDELNIRIDQAEKDFKSGKFKSSSELLEKYK